MLLEISHTIIRQLALRKVYKKLTPEQKAEILAGRTEKERKKIARKIARQHYPWL